MSETEAQNNPASWDVTIQNGHTIINVHTHLNTDIVCDMLSAYNMLHNLRFDLSQATMHERYLYHCGKLQQEIINLKRRFKGCPPITEHNALLARLKQRRELQYQAEAKQIELECRCSDLTHDLHAQRCISWALFVAFCISIAGYIVFYMWL